MGERAGRGSVLVAGAINTDLVATARRAPEAGETVTGDRFAIYGGGKGANQAVSAARSGAPTAMVGAVGRDDFGRQRLADLRAEGIDVDGVAVADEAASGVALISVETGGQNRILYVPGATLSVTPEWGAVAVRRSRASVLLATLELPLATLATMIGAARAGGGTVVLNATPEPGTARELLPEVDVLVVNETEALQLLGMRIEGTERGGAQRDWPGIVGALRGLGPRAVVVTLGADGASVGDGQRTEAIPAKAVDVVDTTGAGDAACGAMAARLDVGDDVFAASRVAVVAGSLATTRAGAQPSMPRWDEIAGCLDAT
jgi:ribokinase